MASARTNAIVIVVLLAWLAHRVLTVGIVEALAELVGLTQLHAYVTWRDAYVPLHRELFTLSIHQLLHPSLARALALHGTEQQVALRALATSHGHAIFTVPLLRPDLCQLLAEEASHFAASEHGMGAAPPNSMNGYGVKLGPDGLEGFEQLLDALRTDVVVPLVDALFSQMASRNKDEDSPTAAVGSAVAAATAATLAEHVAFIVRYNESEQRSLDMHHDASELTLNVCLENDDVEAGEEMINGGGGGGGVDGGGGGGDGGDGGGGGGGLGGGSELLFCGLVGDEAHRQRTVTLRHTVGTGVLHLGRHRHGTTEILRGRTRQNLIMWGRHARTPGSTEGRHRSQLASEELAPDPDCLSWSHDEDFEDYRPLPPEAVLAQEKQRKTAELISLAAQATDEHIAQLPPNHQPVVRMLRQMALASQRESDEEERRRNRTSPSADPMPSTLEIVD